MKPVGVVAAVGVDAVDHRQPVADRIHGQIEHPRLLLVAAGRGLGGMRIDRDRADPVDRDHILVRRLGKVRVAFEGEEMVLTGAEGSSAGQTTRYRRVP